MKNATDAVKSEAKAVKDAARAVEKAKRSLQSVEGAMIDAKAFLATLRATTTAREQRKTDRAKKAWVTSRRRGT